MAVFGITGSCDRAGAVSILVLEERLRTLCRPARRHGVVGARARGWIRVMHLDILCSMVIYTLATIAFTCSGRVLHKSGVVPAQRDTIQVLSRGFYTQTLGELGPLVFYAGAVDHALRHHLRVHRHIHGCTPTPWRAARLRARGPRGERWGATCFCWSWPCCHQALLVFESPVKMVPPAVMAQAAMLPLIGSRRSICGSTRTGGHPAGGGTTVLLWVRRSSCGICPVLRRAQVLR